MPPIRLGLTGVGSRGASLLNTLSGMPDIDIPAVCDVQDRRLTAASDILSDAGRPAPGMFHDHETMLAETDLDGVIIATSWRHHIPLAIQAMQAGIPPAMDVGPASSLKECWDLVETHEATDVDCMLLENCCFRRNVLAVLRMVRAGLFGELVHAECGYCHDLRGGLVAVTESSREDTAEPLEGDRYYRSIHHEHRNGDLYPTHGLGPMATYLDINRGNRFVSLTSRASKAGGLADWANRHLPADHPSQDIDWSHGDIITTVLTCANGETVSITHDVSLPRPDNSKRYLLRGTRGMWQDELDGIYVDGSSPDHEWESFEPYEAEFEHPLWEAYQERGIEAGHGGSDYLVLRAFIESLATKTRPPIDTYDAATWMAISPLSERSISGGSIPVDVPDFTNGRWMTDHPNFDPADSADGVPLVSILPEEISP